jgi:predicted ATPase/DNA-binding CsgD family transcriptional regulator
MPARLRQEVPGYPAQQLPGVTGDFESSIYLICPVNLDAMSDTLDAGARRGYTPLPADVTSFVGRDREISDVRHALSTSRLLTLTGPGGVGKTRLALRVGRQLRRAFPDGTCLVELAQLRDPALLVNVVAEQLGLRDQSSRAAIDTVTEHLRVRQVLLVLDNCEHLVDACAQLVHALLRTCPKVRMLATSRQSLRVPGEHTMAIAPLPVPEPDDHPMPDSLGRYDSVSLFVDRATAVIAGFTVSEDNCEVLARLCRGLEGIPLAVELAAARLRFLSLGQLEERLAQRFRLLTAGTRTAPLRQRTLQALIDWSYELCTSQERLVWSRSSVFSGSFELDAAEYVCQGEGLAADDVLPAIASLIDKSVLSREETEGAIRYQLLETVREYGQSKLTDEANAAVRRRHRDWYAQLLDRLHAEWIGPCQVSWVSRLRREHANLRVALDYCVTQPDEAATGLRMAVLLDDYWDLRGLQTEARHWLDSGLAATPQPTLERLSALRMDGWFALLQGDLDVGKPLLLEAAQLADRLNDRTESAHVTHCWGMATLFMGDVNTAATLLRDGLAKFRASGCRRGEIFEMFLLGVALGIRGDRKEALAMLKECLEITTAAGDVYFRSYALWSVAYLEVLHDHLDRAEDAGMRALRMQWQLDNRLAMAFTIETLAWVTIRRDQPTRAATLFGAASAIWQQIGAAPEYYAPFATSHSEHLDQTRAELGDDCFDNAFRHGSRLPTDAAVRCALGTTISTPSEDREDQPRTVLTRREHQIAELVAEGLSNKEIAAQLVISRRTVETHVEHILVKLGFNNRAQIAAWSADPDFKVTVDISHQPCIDHRRPRIDRRPPPAR